MSAESRALLERIAVVSCLLALVVAGFPRAALAAIGDAVVTRVPTTVGSVPPPNTTFASPTCGSQGGTSLAVVQGSKLKDVNPSTVPVALVVTCLDNNDVQVRARLHFLDAATGIVVKQLSTKIGGVVATPAATPRGWAHLAAQQDKGKLIACGSDGSLYSIDYSQFPTATDDGNATPLLRPALPANCAALTWDPEEDLIYQGVAGNDATVGVYRFPENGTTTTPFGNQAFVNTPGCTPAGVVITGGVLVVACKNQSTILRVDKNTGLQLQPFGQLGVLGQAAGQNLSPSLGDLACDPASFAAQYRDVLWSRNGTNGNGVVALKFPPFTCGLPASATVLWPGLSAPSGGQAGVAPLAACFTNLVNSTPNGNGFDGDVIDAEGDGEGDGLPDCWENDSLWGDTKPGIDFDGDGGRDLALCVMVDTNGDGIADMEECADPYRRNLFVEVDWMQGRQPPAAALMQAQPVATVGIKSVREAFRLAPVDPLGSGVFKGIGLHFQVDEQVLFSTLDPTPNAPKKSTVTELVFTPCTPPAFNPDGTKNPVLLSDAADFDTVKRENFGTAAERGDPNFVNILNAKRLAFRYVLFANKQVGLNGQGGVSNSGCAEVGGDDAAITMAAFTTITTDDVAGTLMHELGHTLGLRHGSIDNTNCKPNLRSVMSYTRQLGFPLGPITGRRLDFSRHDDGPLDEANLNEGLGIGGDPTLSPIMQFDPVTLQEVTLFSTADQIAYPGLLGAWSVADARGVTCAIGAHCFNWNQSTTNKGVPTYSTPVAVNLNVGSGGCPGTQTGTLLVGNNDWESLQYRASATLEFAGGVGHGHPEQDIDVTQAVALGLSTDTEPNGVADSQDCGTVNGTPVLCTHRIDIKPSFPLPKIIDLGAEANITIAIFSEVGWDATTLVNRNSLVFHVGSIAIQVKLNNKGSGTCSVSDKPDPNTGQKDGLKDLQCQFPTSSLPEGTYIGVVTGTFQDQATGTRNFLATQEVTIEP